GAVPIPHIKIFFLHCAALLNALMFMPFSSKSSRDIMGIYGLVRSLAAVALNTQPVQVWQVVPLHPLPSFGQSAHILFSFSIVFSSYCIHTGRCDTIGAALV